MFIKFADFVTYSLFSLERGTRTADSFHFFIADIFKIFFLLVVIIFCVSFFRTYLQPEKVRSILSREKKIAGNVLAALLGIATPFCTCSAIPLFMGFVESGVPLGVTFSFLVSSPMINEVAVVMLIGMFGWRIAAIYILSGFFIAVVSGIVIDKLKLDYLVEKFEAKGFPRNYFPEVEIHFSDRVKIAKYTTKDIFKKVWIYVVIGVGIGSLMHGYVPSDFLAKYAGKGVWYAVPFATLLGIPLYSNVAGIIPLVSVLTEKGVSLGTSLAFMMSVTALSLPEFMILKRVMKLKLLLIFFGIVGLGIMFTGFLFNLLIR